MPALARRATEVMAFDISAKVVELARKRNLAAAGCVNDARELAYRDGTRFTWPDGLEFRERKKAPVSTKNQAQRWGRTREQFLLERGPKRDRKEVPTLAVFAPRFLEDYAEANRQKPSGIAAKETILRVHLVPLLGKKKLDAINNEDVQRVKRHLRDKAPKTVNNVLSVLNTSLKVAVAWEVIERMPCTIKLLPVPRTDASFHDFDEYEWLVEAAKRTDERAHLIVLLGGEAGLRCGEMMAWRGATSTSRSVNFKSPVQIGRGG